MNALVPPPPPDIRPSPSPAGNTSALKGNGTVIPLPSHAQTVAALRHFDAIEKELKVLLKNPDVGRTDMRSAIIDGVTRLVSIGIMTPGLAVTQLGSVPDRPFDQKRWLETHLMQTTKSAALILDHHRMGFAGQQVDETPPDNDNHAGTIAGLLSTYKGGTGG